MKNIFVLGSCVSRDAFALDESKDCRLVGYLARTSFASSFHDQAVKGIDLSSIPSMFQKRMVENDLLKKTKSVLINTKFDWLVIDLIDERFSIFVSDEQEIITLSPELENNCKIDKEGSVLHPGSEEMMEYWKDGWSRFIDFATQNKFLHKIVLNKVFWTNQTDKEEKVVASTYQSWFDGNNRWLQKLYAHIETVGGVKVLEHPGELLIADSNHKWGLQPYHYTKPLYLHLLDYLGQMQAYQHALERGIIYTDFLPLTLETLPIQRHGMFDCEPLIFQGGAEDCSVIINLTVASGKLVGERDLLHTLKCDSMSDDWYVRQNYVYSTAEGIGYYKYISTQLSAVYDRRISFAVPAHTRVAFTIREFYPKGKSVVLEADIYREQDQFRIVC